MKRILTATCFALASIAVSAAGFMPWTDVMMGADADGNGAISMSEVKNYKLGSRFVGFQPFMVDHFAELDTDGDGQISMYELKKGTMDMDMTDSEVSTGFYRGFGFMPRSN